MSRKKVRLKQWYANCFYIFVILCHAVPVHVTPPILYACRQFLLQSEVRQCGENSTMGGHDGYGLVQFVYTCHNFLFFFILWRHYSWIINSLLKCKIKNAHSILILHNNDGYTVVKGTVTTTTLPPICFFMNLPFWAPEWSVKAFYNMVLNSRISSYIKSSKYIINILYPCKS